MEDATSELSQTTQIAECSLGGLGDTGGIAGVAAGVAAGGIVDIVEDYCCLDPSSLCECEEVILPDEEELGSMRAVNKLMILQDVPVDPDEMYYFTCKARIVSDTPGEMWTTINVKVIFFDQKGKKRANRFCRMNNVRQEDGWVEVGGDFTTPSNVMSIAIKVVLGNSKTEVQVAPRSFSLSRLLPNPDWRQEADHRIEYLRKGTIVFKVKVSENYDPSKLQFKLEQKKASFPFGTAVDSSRLAGKKEEDHKYREFLFNYFNWATPANDVKWRIMERKEGDPQFQAGDTALDILQGAGLKVRGHCLMWARTSRIPSWLINQDTEAVWDNVTRRLDYCAQHWQDRFSHWDVDNEQLHEAWYAEKLDDPNFLSRIFKKFNKLQPNVTLFTNDFNVFVEGMFTQAYKQQVRKLLRYQAPIGAVGIQAHFSNTSDINLLIKRLEVLSEPRVPLWLTELDVRVEDAETRAQLYEDVMRLCYSHPNIYGIIMWGFWDGATEVPQAAIVDGPDFELNESGKRLMKLWREEWWTNETVSLPESAAYGREVQVSVQAFHGTHSLSMLYDGQTLITRELQLKPGKTLVLHVDF